MSNAWHGKKRSSFPPDEVDATGKKQVSTPIKYFGREAAKEKGSGLSRPRNGEESSSVPCLAWKKKIDAEANVVSAPKR